MEESSGIYLILLAILIGVVGVILYNQVNKINDAIMVGCQLAPKPQPILVMKAEEVVSAIAKDPVPSRGASILPAKPAQPPASPMNDSKVVVTTSVEATKPTAAKAPSSDQLPPASPVASSLTAEVSKVVNK